MREPLGSGRSRRLNVPDGISREVAGLISMENELFLDWAH
jgi:hypothetical protein